MNILQTKGGRLTALNIAVALTFCIIWAKPVQINWTLSSQEENIRLDRAPIMTLAELRSEGQELHKAARTGATEDPLGYYRFLGRKFRIEAAYQRFQRDHNIRDMRVEAAVIDSNMGGVNQLQTAYQDRFGLEKMQQLSEEGGKLSNEYSPVVYHPTGVSYASFWSAMGEAYLECILLALFFLVGRLKQYELNVLVESWRLPAVALAWPIAIFYYPVRVDPHRQLQRARQFAAFCFSSLMSFAGMATTGAYAQSSGKTASRSPHSLSVEMPSILATSQVLSAKLLKNGRVPETGPIVQADLTASWKNGISVSVYGQDNFQGHTGVGRREIDGSISWASKYLRLGLSYFDISPALRDSKANVLSPSIELDLPRQLGPHHKLIPFARFEWLQAFRQAAANSGGLTIVGMKHDWQLPHDVSVNQTLWGLHDNSVFGSDRGMMGRYKLGVHVSIGHGITFDPLLFDLSVPLVGIHDREVEAIVGMGISVQLH